MSALNELQDKDNYSNWYQWTGNRSLQLEVVPDVVAEFDKLSSELALLKAELKEARKVIDGTKRLKALLSKDGDYSICRSNKEPMWLGDELIIGGIMEDIDNALLVLDSLRPEKL